jgi:hypothetical protein
MKIKPEFRRLGTRSPVVQIMQAEKYLAAVAIVNWTSMTRDHISLYLKPSTPPWNSSDLGQLELEGTSSRGIDDALLVLWANPSHPSKHT